MKTFNNKVENCLNYLGEKACLDGKWFYDFFFHVPLGHYSCISPTRCPEGLWLIENNSREGVPVTSTTDFYYHEYHLPFPDKRPKKKDAERDMKAFDEISYVTDYVPLMKFNGLYTPWSSSMGAFIYLMSFSLVFSTYMRVMICTTRVNLGDPNA